SAMVLGLCRRNFSGIERTPKMPSRRRSRSSPAEPGHQPSALCGPNRPARRLPAFRRWFRTDVDRQGHLAKKPRFPKTSTATRFIFLSGFRMRYLITGATGFVGGHIAKACVARGRQVVTIARVTSNTGELEKEGVTIHRGDIVDP